MKNSYAIGPVLLKQLMLALLFLLGSELMVGSPAQACNISGYPEVGGGCGDIAPAPPAPGPCTGSCCSGNCCENGSDCCEGNNSSSSGGGNGPFGSSSGGGLGGRGAWRGKPIALFSGQENLTVKDLVINGTYPISVVRSYDSGSRYDSPLGYGWSLSLDKRLYKYADNSVVIRTGCGVRNKYQLIGGVYQNSAKGRQPTLVEQSNGSFVLTFANGGKEIYDAQGKLTVKHDARGNKLEFTYDSRGRLPLTGSSPYSLTPTVPSIVGYDYRLTQVTEKLADGTLTGNAVTLTYIDTTGRLQKITANDGREVTYQQDQTSTARNGNLLNVTGLAGVNSIYQYTDAKYTHALTHVQHGSATDTAYVNAYSATTGKVTSQTFGKDTYEFFYGPLASPALTVLQTAVKHSVRNSANVVLASETTTYTFDGGGFPKVIEWALTSGPKYKKELVRNASSNLVDTEILSEWPVGATGYSVKSSVGYQYDTAGNKTQQSVALAGGEVVTKSWTYDNGWVSSEQSVSSLAPTKLFRTEYAFFYDSNGKPTNIKDQKRRLDDGSFQTTSFTYDANGRLLDTISPSGLIARNIYTAGRLTGTEWVDGATVLPNLKKVYGYDARGNISSITDAKNGTTSVEYDDLRRIIKQTNALGEEIHYRYTGKLLTEVEVGRTAANGEGQITQNFYTAEGWLQTVKRKKDDGTLLTVESYTYNSVGQPLTAVKYREGVALTTSYEYDALGRMVKMTDPGGNPTRYGYDANNNRTSMIDAKNRQTDYTYDALGRVIRIELKGITPSAVTTLTYDAAGNLLSVTDAETNVTQYVYDALSRRTQVIQPLGQSTTYVYDAMNRVDYIVNARGQKTDYSYMFWGAVQRVDYYPSESASNYSRRVEYAYDNNANVTTITDSAVGNTPIYQFTYDALNRTDITTIGYIPAPVSLDYDYDRYGNRKKLVLQDANTAAHDFTFNKLNQLSTVSLPGSQNLGISYYADAGWLKQINFPSGVASAYGYFNTGAVSSIATTGTVGVLDQLDYLYDETLNLTKLTSSRDNGEHGYGYDGLDRLTATQRPAGFGLDNESYEYDKVGNRELPGAPTTYGYDANNRVVDGAGLIYGHDTDGNRINSSDGKSFSYDSDNRLIGYGDGSHSATYAYDPFGQRVRKTVNGNTTYYVWDQGRLIAEYSSAGVRQKRYAYLPSDVTPRQMQDANGIYDVHQDHLHTPRLLTDASQNIVWSAKRSAFGVASIDGDPDGNGTVVSFNPGFAGQYYDSESGVYQNQYRDYDAKTGRYLQRDPLGLVAGINSYIYAFDNPLKFFDPSGLDPAGYNLDGPGMPGAPEGPNMTGKGAGWGAAADGVGLLNEGMKAKCDHSYSTFVGYELDFHQQQADASCEQVDFYVVYDVLYNGCRINMAVSYSGQVVCSVRPAYLDPMKLIQQAFEPSCGVEKFSVTPKKRECYLCRVPR